MFKYPGKYEKPPNLLDRNNSAKNPPRKKKDTQNQ